MMDLPYEVQSDRSPPEATDAVRDLSGTPGITGMGNSSERLAPSAAPLGQDLSARLQRLLQETEAESARAPLGLAESSPSADAGAARGTEGPEASGATYATGATAGAAAGATAETAAGVGVPGGVLSWLMAHPELLKMLPTLLHALGPLLRAPSAGTGTSAPSPSATAVMADAGSSPVGATSVPTAAATPVSVRPAPVSHASLNRHIPLLKALRPYLAPERRQAMDTVITLCQVWDTLQGLGISLFPLLSPPDAATPAGAVPERGTSDV